jgi:CubicO group peptidase (beta-lactamase class C family)
MIRILLAVMLLPVYLNAQNIAQKADELLTAYTEQQKFSGNVLIAKDGNIIFEKAYGYADKSSGKVNTTETEFRVGSLTKMFTSTVILQLEEEGKLSLNDPVSKYVNDFAYGDQVRLLHLLSHTSGIKGSNESPAPTTLEESVNKFKVQSLAFTPGSRFEYNNFNYILLSYIAQKVSGITFPQLIETRLLRKSNMHHSGLDSKERRSDNKAFGYITNPETATWEVANDGNVGMASGAGALYSTTKDLYTWSTEISKRLVLNDSILSKAIRPIQNNYGLGWMVGQSRGRTYVGHTGSIPGFIANFMKFPKEDVTIILLSNYQDVNGRQLSDDLIAVAFDEPYHLPVKKNVIAMTGEKLKKYAGEYRLGNGFSIMVSVEGEKLYALAKGDAQKIELTPESDSKFFLKGPETEIEFLQESNVVKYMFVNMQGGQKFEKVK